MKGIYLEYLGESQVEKSILYIVSCGQTFILDTV